MKIFYDLNTFNVAKPVVTIGTFDGVHLGHRKVLARLREIAMAINGETVIFTFFPHPRQVLSPDEKNLRLITTLEEKIKLLESYGVDNLVVYPFTIEFSKLNYAEFIKLVVVEQLKTACLVVGYDHRFGNNREGGYEYLEEFAIRYGFRIEKMDALLMDESHISSTRIREALEKGDVQRANRFLGYPFTLMGRVIEGQQMGRKIGFPTANIEASDVNKLIPGYGVYAVKLIIEGKTWLGMLNIGSRPTFNQNADQRSIEVHIFDFHEHIYGKEITLIFIDKIRNEQKFAGVDELVLQLHNDKSSALQIMVETDW